MIQMTKHRIFQHCDIKPESQIFEARKESWRFAFPCKSLLKHVPVAMNIHTTGGPIGGGIF